MATREISVAAIDSEDYLLGEGMIKRERRCTQHLKYEQRAPVAFINFALGEIIFIDYLPF